MRSAGARRAVKMAALVTAGVYELATISLAIFFYRSSWSDSFWHIDGIVSHLWMVGFSIFLSGGICAFAVLLPGALLSVCYVAAVSARERTERAPQQPDVSSRRSAMPGEGDPRSSLPESRRTVGR